MKYLALFAVVVALVACSTPQASTPIQNLRETSVHIMNGSGGVVRAKSGQTYLLTNFHVCVNARVDGEVVGTYPDGTSVRGPVVEEDVAGDLCLIKVTATKGALVIGEAPKVGDRLYTRGYPYGILGEFDGVILGYTEYNYTYSIYDLGECPKGTVRRYGHNDRLVGCEVTNKNTVTTIYAAPGSSGSPVVDGAGNIVGVVESHLHQAMPNKGNAGLVPYSYVKAILARH